MTSRLTTHVLDLSIGKPASGVMVELWGMGADDQLELTQICFTNEDGRVDQPILEGESMKKGIYEIRFHIGEYYRKRGMAAEEPPFLDCVPVRFGISNEDSHYHVPLLIAPGGYSTYRGS